MKNKKGMMDDFFDLIFTVIAAFFLFIFITAALQGGIKDSNQRAVMEVNDFKRAEAAINNLRVNMYQGYNLEGTDLTRKITSSRELGGRTITTCSDYLEESNCDTDVLGLVHPASGLKCFWQTEKRICLLVSIND